MMAVVFSPSTDFEDITDGLEAVTLVRRGKTSTSVAKALQRAISTHEVEISDGKYRAGDVRWHLPAAEVTTAPEPGDKIKDAGGNYYTLLDVQAATLENRWRCIARNVEVANLLNDTFSFEKATFSKGTQGAAEASYTGDMVARGRLQPVDTTMVVEAGAKRSAKRWRLFVASDLAITHEHRVKGPGGTYYTILSTAGQERIGEVQTVEVSEWRRG